MSDDKITASEQIRAMQSKLRFGKFAGQPDDSDDDDDDHNDNDDDDDVETTRDEIVGRPLSLDAKNLQYLEENDLNEETTDRGPLTPKMRQDDAVLLTNDSSKRLIDYKEIFKNNAEDYNDSDHTGDSSPTTPVSDEAKTLADKLVEEVIENAKTIDRLVLQVVYANQDSCYMNEKAWDEFRIKGKSSLARKLDDIYSKRNPKDSLTSFQDFFAKSKNIPKDIYRLTIIIDDDADFQSTFWNLIDGLRKKELKLIQLKNYFKAGNSYKGTNNIFRYNNGRQTLEIQIHTERSLYIKQYLTHKDYEKARTIKGCDQKNYCTRKALIDECVAKSAELPNFDLVIPKGKEYLLEDLEGKGWSFEDPEEIRNQNILTKDEALDSLKAKSNKAETCPDDIDCTSIMQSGGKKSRKKNNKRTRRSRHHHSRRKKKYTKKRLSKKRKYKYRRTRFIKKS